MVCLLRNHSILVLRVLLFWWLRERVEAASFSFRLCEDEGIPVCNLQEPDAIVFQVYSSTSCGSLCSRYNSDSDNRFIDSEKIKANLFSKYTVSSTKTRYTPLLLSHISSFTIDRDNSLIYFGNLSFTAFALPPVDYDRFNLSLGCVAFNYETSTQTCLLFKPKTVNRSSSAQLDISSFYDQISSSVVFQSVYLNQPTSRNDKFNGYSCFHYQMKFYPRQSCFFGKTDCSEVNLQGSGDNGVYYISTPLGIRPVFCHYSIIGGRPVVGMLIQRRVLGTIDFNRSWSEYEDGFGEFDTDHWLGNKYISSLTSSKSYKLAVEMVAFDDSSAYALYSSFVVGASSTKYQLSVSGYSGNAGDSLTPHDGMAFSTTDRDNDVYAPYSCAKEYGSGWWFRDCYDCNLNGVMTGPFASHISAGAMWLLFKRKNMSCYMKIYL